MGAVSPGGGFVVVGVVGEAAVEDADQAVGDCSQGRVVGGACCAVLVVVVRAPGETVIAENACW